MMTPPKYVLPLLRELERHGHTAAVAGGYLRDSLLGLVPGDCDVATSALPDEVEAIFSNYGGGVHTVPTGKKHGTILVVGFGEPVEVTTFRREGGYTDHRRPDHVDFVRDIREDCARRDFTVNAMMLGADGTIYDFFGGQRDLADGIIRAVGEPALRFEEDALRMFRALRFAARLGFAIEPRTFDALMRSAELCRFLAAERIAAELRGILLSPRPQYAAKAAEYGLLNAFLSKRPEGSFDTLSDIPPVLELRFSAFCALLKEYNCIASCEGFAAALRLPSAVTVLSAALDRRLGAALPRSRAEVKALMHACGVHAAKALAAAWKAAGRRDITVDIDSVLASGECFSLRSLAVSGRDIAALGYRGTEIGDALERLLCHVFEHPEDNTYDALLEVFHRQKSAL